MVKQILLTLLKVFLKTQFLKLKTPTQFYEIKFQILNLFPALAATTPTTQICIGNLLLKEPCQIQEQGRIEKVQFLLLVK